jgi:hypothetical protein
VQGKCVLLERNIDKNLITKIEHYFEGLHLPIPEEGPDPLSNDKTFFTLTPDYLYTT